MSPSRIFGLVQKLSSTYRGVGTANGRIVEIGSFLGGLESDHQRTEAGNVSLPRLASDPPFSETGTWELLGGGKGTRSWENRGYKRARSIVEFGGRLLVGLDGGAEGRAALYAYDGGRWDKIGGGGINGSWAHGLEVHSLAVHDEKLYAGLSSKSHGPEVWEFDDVEWRLVGSEKQSGWSVERYFSVSAMASHAPGLVVGLQNHGKYPTPESNRNSCTEQAPLYRFSDGGWSRIADGQTWGRNRPYNCAYDMHTAADGSLYVGFFSVGLNIGDVWRIAPDGELSRIAGGGLNKSWIHTSQVLRIRSHGGHITAVYNRQPAAAGDYSSVWHYDGRSWSPVGLGGIPPEWSMLYSFNALCTYRGKLVVGAGGYPPGNSSVWYFDDDGYWKRFGGYGVNGSWGQQTWRRTPAPLVRKSGAEYVYQLTEYNGNLIAGFGASPNCAQVWRFSPK